MTEKLKVMCVEKFGCDGKVESLKKNLELNSAKVQRYMLSKLSLGSFSSRALNSLQIGGWTRMACRQCAEITKRHGQRWPGRYGRERPPQHGWRQMERIKPDAGNVTASDASDGGWA